MKFGTLQSLARRGHISPRSVVRGPTTEQMWTFVATVRGLSREFGLCFHCGEGIEPTAIQCTHCGRSQDAPADSDALMETPGQTPLPTPLAPPTPPVDMFSSLSAKVSDSGMEGGTSLDLQADSLTFTPMPPEKRAELPARVPAARPTSLVQRAPVPVKEESILTARELAAAFQLDFRPPGGRNGGGKVRRPVRTLAGLVLIAAIAGVILLGLRADWREKTFTWVSERWGSLAASLEQPAKQAGTGKAVAPKPDPVAPPMSREPAKGPTTPVIPPRPQPVVETPPAVVKPEPRVEPKPEPKVETPAPVVVTPPPPKPAPVYVPPPAPPAADIPTEDLTIEQATVRASDLRLKAIDAQTKNDWATALHLYEQIQRLPRDAWPADLSLRLDVARRKATTP